VREKKPQLTYLMREYVRAVAMYKSATARKVAKTAQKHYDSAAKLLAAIDAYFAAMPKPAPTPMPTPPAPVPTPA
jgi:hypothetical protein